MKLELKRIKEKMCKPTTHNFVQAVMPPNIHANFVVFCTKCGAIRSPFPVPGR